MALTKQAKPYGLGTSVDEIFPALQAGFSISAVDASPRIAPQAAYLSSITHNNGEETGTDRV